MYQLKSLQRPFQIRGVADSISGHMANVQKGGGFLLDHRRSGPFERRYALGVAQGNLCWRIGVVSVCI